MTGRLYNEDATEALADIVSECVNPVIVTDPPYNRGYHYRSYGDRIPEAEYYDFLARMVAEWPTVLVLYPEALHTVSIAARQAPRRVVSWVYPSNTARQHRDIGFYGVSPDFGRVRRPYRNPRDKRIQRLQARTGGARSYDWLMVDQVKNVSREKTAHPCQMPLAVMYDVVRWLPDGVTVVDPFAGSGTTLVACERAGIPWRGIEMDPEYCEIAARRIQEVDS